MNSYFVLHKERKKSPGVPVFLNGAIHERFDPKLLDKSIPYDWQLPVRGFQDPDPALSYPDELWLIAREKRLAFDIMDKTAGIVVSDRFLDILDSDEINKFKISKLNTVNVKGENISDRDMFYMKQIKAFDVVDLEKSDWIQLKKNGELWSNPDGRPRIGLINKLVLDEECISKRSLFTPRDLGFNDIFVSEDLMARMRVKGIVGVDYDPAEYYNQYYRTRAYKMIWEDMEREYGRQIYGGWSNSGDAMPKTLG